METHGSFDILNAPLKGGGLIEASAGTGKTYTLTALYIRLVVERSLPVDRILVVTFTEAATSELKQRIRTRLRDAVRGFSGEPPKDAFLNELVAVSEPRPALRNLRRALRDFDQAAVFTIHGFCRRVLLDHAFESGLPFDTELVTDVSTFRREIVEDFWRRHISTASPLFARYALENRFTPGDLSSLAASVPGPVRPLVLPEVPPVDTRPLEEAYLDALWRVKAAWGESCREVEGILLDHEGLHRGKYRKDSVRKWLVLMKSFADPKAGDRFTFSGFVKFTAGHIASSMKKGHPPPSHPFFTECERLIHAEEDLLNGYSLELVQLKAELLDELRDELRARKDSRNVQSFDDLLLNVLRALEGPSGKRLARTLAEQFEAALIDEFQDTDPVQYGIFKRIFADPATPLFLIGDPKQAVYGFRGADVFAYLEAARGAERRYTLPRNYRSDPRLVRAVNAIFRRHPRPFALEAISFPRVEPGLDEKDLVVLRLDGGKMPALEVRVISSEGRQGSNGKITKGTGMDLITSELCAEISGLVSLGRQGRVFLGERPLREEDMAVLVRTNREARIVQQSLAGARIPSVLHTLSSLFETPETVEAARLLSAVSRPESEGLVRAALSTDIFGLSAEDIEGLILEPESWEQRLILFRRDHDTWKERGFVEMFRGLLSREKTLWRWLGYPDGERRVTNLLHLMEVLHRAETRGRLSMEGLVKWLSDQRDPSTRGTEEQPLRLESDANAVQVVTVHKSKGLEYPVVFCPFVWGGLKTPRSEDPVVFHLDEEGRRPAVDIGSPSEERARHAALAKLENFSENLRLFYVALTRARNRCVLIWGKFNKAETSAPAYLFHARGLPANQDPIAFTVKCFEDLGDEGILGDLERIRDESGNAIHVAPLEEGTVAPPEPPGKGKAPHLSARAFSGRIDWSRKIASFSSLTSSRAHGEALPDRDLEGPSTVPDEDAGLEAPRQGFFAFPAGARSGTCLHEMFEFLDFMDAGPETLGPLVREKLAAHGFDAAWENVVAGMIRNVLSAPLMEDDPGLRLEHIPTASRLNELPFFHPLQDISPRKLGEVLARHTGAGLPRELPDRIERLGFSPCRGYMRGFMDLVFEKDGRFYIVDWKSNDLGPDIRYYSAGAVQRAMLEGLYHLQYLVYTVALDRYLALRVPGYDYEVHFGGVFYVFLRGAGAGGGEVKGVFHDRPGRALVEDLEEVLLG